MDTLRNLLPRLAYNTTGFKALFTIGIVAVLCLHDFNAQNAHVLEVLIGFALGAKIAQYAADTVKGLKSGTSN